MLIPTFSNNSDLSSNLDRLLPGDDNSLQLNNCAISCVKQEKALLLLLLLIIYAPEGIGE